MSDGDSEQGLRVARVDLGTDNRWEALFESRGSESGEAAAAGRKFRVFSGRVTSIDRHARIAVGPWRSSCRTPAVIAAADTRRWSAHDRYEGRGGVSPGGH
jgi:hypothetical protein